MSTKRVSYMNLLKEAISEFDTTKTVDVKGPFIDPIVGYDGNGELQTHKDASGILERYYFDNEEDKGVQVETTSTPKAGDKDKPMEEVTPDSVDSIKKDIEDAVNMKYEQKGEDEEKDESSEDEDAEDESPEGEAKEEMSESEKMEEAVLEKLIAEMEEDIAEMDFTKDTNQTEPAGDPDKDNSGQIPDRKDVADKFTKPAKISELDDIFSEQDEESDDEAADEGDEEEEGGDEKLDVDKKMSESAIRRPYSSADQDLDELNEQFRIFSEEIEDMETEVKKK